MIFRCAKINGFIVILMILFATKQIYGSKRQTGYSKDTINRLEKYDLDSLIFILKLEMFTMKKSNRDNAKIVILIKLIMHLVRQKMRVEKDRLYWRLRQG